MIPKARIWVVCTALTIVLLAGQSLAVFGGTAPSLLSPFALPLVIPSFFGVPRAGVALGFGAVFVAWQPALLNGAAEIPRRTGVLWFATTLLSAAYFATSWRYGFQYQGAAYVRTGIALSATLCGLSSVLLWRAEKAPSFARALGAQAALFVWLATYAFPYLGETP